MERLSGLGGEPLEAGLPQVAPHKTQAGDHLRPQRKVACVRLPPHRTRWPWRFIGYIPRRKLPARLLFAPVDLVHADGLNVPSLRCAKPHWTDHSPER